MQREGETTLFFILFSAASRSSSDSRSRDVLFG